VAAWDDESAGDVEWGIETIRATGEAFPLSDDPIAARQNA
jgi:hypothetical protein